MLQGHIFNKIIHLADIHIPINLYLSGKKEEYQCVFETLYHELDKYKEDSLIIIAGDLIHSKIEMQNETQLMARQFLTTLGSICPTVVVLGNHDFLENNRQRTTSLEVICDHLPNVIPFIYSGHYVIGNIHFGFSSLLDNKIVLASDLPSNILKCGVFHGIITDWYPKFSKGIPLSTFNGYDIIVLGHVHKQQIHQFETPPYTVAYAGSLLQQNFGESVEGHGFLLWDLETKHVTPIPIFNEHVRITLHINQGILTNNEELLRYKNRKLHIRLKCENTNLETYKLFKNTLLHYYPNTQSVQLAQPLTKKRASTRVDESLSELEYLANHSRFPSEIKQLHSDIRNKIHKDKDPKGEWNIIKIEFENIFRYKGQNTMNWDLGLYALSAANMSGKTSLFLIVLFGLFGKISKNEGSRFTDILHHGETSGYIQIEFQQNEWNYKIRRDIFFRKPKKIGSQLHFWCEDHDLTEATVNKTQNKMNEMIGTFDSFVSLHIVSNRFSIPCLQMSAGEKFQHFWDQCNLNCFQEYAEICDKMYTNICETKICETTTYENSDLGQLPQITQLEIHKKKAPETKQELQRRYHSLISNLCPPSKWISQHRPPTRSKHELKLHLASVQQFYGYLMYHYQCENISQLQELLANNSTMDKGAELVARLQNAYMIDHVLHQDLIQFLYTNCNSYKRDFETLVKMQQHQQVVEEELHGIYLKELSEMEYCKTGLEWYKQQEIHQESKESEQERQDTINSKKTKLQEEYIECMQQDELPLTVFVSKMKQFVSHVNLIFQPFTTYTFDLNWDRIKQHRIYFVIRHNDYVLEPERLSGYESIVLLVSINYALLYLNETSHANMLWIDESFDCLDDERFTTDLPKLIEYLKELYGTIVLISFRAIPFSIINHRIHIQLDGKVSRISI